MKGNICIDKTLAKPKKDNTEEVRSLIYRRTAEIIRQLGKKRTSINANKLIAYVGQYKLKRK